MNIRRIAVDFKAELRVLARSKGVLFWTLLFPILLILLFGAIFSGADSVSYTLYVQDLDTSESSQQFLDTLNQTQVFSITMVATDVDVESFIQTENIKRLLVIPADFQQSIHQSFIDTNKTVNMTFYYDQSEQSNQAVHTIINSVLQHMNMKLSGGRTIVGITGIETISGEFSYIDFFLPGMIGFTIMQTCIYGSIERNTKHRKDGILRKMLTTPITRTEWIISKMLFQLFLSFISGILIIVFGIVVFQLNVHINAFFFILVIFTSFLFTGMGMVVARFVRDEESAGMAGGVITFPMMFLAGTFFPVDQMPEFIQYIAYALPLYYINEGFRNAMIYMRYSDTVLFTTITAVMGIVFFIAGILLTKWNES